MAQRNGQGYGSRVFMDMCEIWTWRGMGMGRVLSVDCEGDRSTVEVDCEMGS